MDVQAPFWSMTEQSKSTQTALGGFCVMKQSSEKLWSVNKVSPMGVDTSVHTLSSPLKVPPTQTMLEIVKMEKVEISGSTVTVDEMVTVSVTIVVGMQFGLYGFRMVKNPELKQVPATPTAQREVSSVQSVGVVNDEQVGGVVVTVTQVSVLVSVLVSVVSLVVTVIVLVQPSWVVSAGTQSACPANESSQTKPQGQCVRTRSVQFK